MEEPSPSLREMVESVRPELDGYSWTRRCGRSLRRPLSNLASCSCWMIERIDELEHLIRLWRNVAFQRGPGHQVATRYLTFAFSNLFLEIHSLLAVDKSGIDPKELQALEKISPEIIAVLPNAARLIDEEGLAFLARPRSAKPPRRRSSGSLRTPREGAWDAERGREVGALCAAAWTEGDCVENVTNLPSGKH